MVIKETFFTMTDGVRLYTRIVLPEEGKKLPIVLFRTPYEERRNGEPYPAERYEGSLFLKNGYAIIVQHVRGRGDSEGDCVPYQERQDGLDTLAIIRTLPFYDGQIYITGGSYLATVHYCYLDTNPKDIKAAALSIQTDDMYTRNFRNGCNYRWSNLDWWLSMLINRYPQQKPWTEVLQRPYCKVMERAVGEDVPEYTGMLLNETYNEFWKSRENVHAAERLTIPTLFTEGWFDFYIDGMFSVWEKLPQETRKKCTFVVGPWGHSASVSEKAEYPLEHGDLPDTRIVNFFNSIRDNTPYRDFELGKVNYYNLGEDRWTTEPETAREQRLYFNADHTLSDSVKVSGEENYLFDPEKPLGHYRYHDIYKRPADTPEGVLTFLSEPFEADTDIYGKIRWHMNVKSDCEDTAFFMRVYFEEDGISYNLTETITSLSHICENYVPGEPCTVDILTPPIGVRIKKGKRIRVDISSHSDQYVPHANVKGHWAKVECCKVAENTVIFDEEGYIALPVR